MFWLWDGGQLPSLSIIWFVVLFEPLSLLGKNSVNLQPLMISCNDSTGKSKNPHNIRESDVLQVSRISSIVILTLILWSSHQTPTIRKAEPADCFQFYWHRVNSVEEKGVKLSARKPIVINWKAEPTYVRCNNTWKSTTHFTGTVVAFR